MITPLNDTVMSETGAAPIVARDRARAERRHLFGMNVPYSVKMKNHWSDTIMV